MKKLLLFFSLLLSLLPLSLPAAAETYTWNITGSESLKQSASSTIALHSVTWTVSQKSFGSSLFAQRSGKTGLLFGSSSNKVKEIGFSATQPFAGKTIKKVTTTAFAKTANAISVTLKIDDTEIAVSNKLSTTSNTYSFEAVNVKCANNIALIYSQPSATSNSVTISGISIEYEETPTGPVDFEYTLPESKELEEGSTFDLGLPEKRPSNITWTSDNPEVAEIENGIINAKKEGTANIKMTWESDANFNASSEEGQTIVVTVTKPAPVGVPVVTINDKTIEDGCFYEISNGSTATITADNANDITVNGKKVENGAFIIDAATLYEITASNDVSEESLSFNVRLIEPQQGEPTPEVWKQINNVADVTLDGKYIIVANNQKVAISTSASGNYMGNASVTIDNNSIATLPTNAMVFTLSNTENEGQYRWNCTNAADNTSLECYLYSGTGSNNHLKAGDNSNLSVSTISINETSGVATITFVNCKNSDGTARHIGCNTSNKNVFGAYATNSQASVFIYKLFGGEPTPIHSTKEYLDLPDFEHNVTAKTITFTCSNPNVLFEEKHYDATSAQSYAPKAVADGWNAMADGVFDHSAFTNDIILETRAYREDAAGNRLVESPIHAMRVSASGTVTGIESVAAEAEAEGALYNLQGVRVDRATAAPGLYIERRSGKAVKVIL